MTTVLQNGRVIVTDQWESEELTEEDLIAWFDVQYRLKRAGSFLWTRSLMQDTRCSELMLEAQEIALCGGCAIELYGIAVRGWDEKNATVG